MERRIPAWASGAVLALASLGYLVFFAGALPAAADLALLGGAGAAAVLAVLAYRQGRPVRLIAVSLAVGLLLCVAAYFGVLLLAAWPEVYPASVAYTVAVTGLAGRTGTGATTVLVPLPVTDGELLYPASSLENQTFGAWTTAIAGTDRGEMLAFTTGEEDLTDIDAGFYRFETGINGTHRPLREHLSPVVGEVDSGYLTVVAVDGLAAPVQVSFDLRLSTGGGLYHGMPADRYLTEAGETVPAGAGPVTVTATVSRYQPGGPGESGEWVPV
ncbi:MAG: hypothetical protein PHP59_02350 [Methanofollis sp.]|uniref:hypothetical protein n=1 Tax=Methanofollis sp. TaxID=2052835 RepID=UPI00262D6A93|nr:hypothetical protein [Methanofollis sp.]MDD4254198.1 hypothetical protein [Methanofollis sp.]